MTTSKAAIHDIDHLAMLFDEYRVFYQRKTDLQGSREFLSQRIANNDSEIFVARSSDGALMGFVQLYPILSSVQMKKLWLLNDLYVGPSFRGMNVSVMLIDCAKRLAMETGSAGLILETAKSNAIGNNLYVKTDFALDNDHNYYSWSC